MMWEMTQKVVIMQGNAYKAYSIRGCPKHPSIVVAGEKGLR